jgi:RHS repeat-associated protein
LQFDKEGDSAVTGADLSHRYLWQANAVDQLMADERTQLDSNSNIVTDEVLWAITDQHGSVHDLVRMDGTTTSVVDHIIYDSFGKVASESNPAEGCLFKFTGRATDNNTGIEFHNLRVKIAGSADWLKPDPIGFYGGQMNLYVYCGNSPTNATDPTGCATPEARQLLNYFAKLKRMKLSDNEMVKQLIEKALRLTDGNAQEAFALIYEIRHIPGADNDIWASLDHFFNAWTTRNIVPIGGIAGFGALAWNHIYSGLKYFDYTRLKLPRDNPNIPPSPVTLLQYCWGNRGAWFAIWYSSNLSIGSPEWRDFLKWLYLDE